MKFDRDSARAVALLVLGEYVLNHLAGSGFSGLYWVGDGFFIGLIGTLTYP